MRSDTSRISSTSLDNTTAAPPARASAVSRSPMPRRAPMSTPRNGSSSTASRGSADSQRPTTTFCWLPPERSSIGVSVDSATTPRSAITPTARLVSRVRRSRPHNDDSRRNGRLTTRSSDHPGSTACRWRSSGTSTTPARMASPGRFGAYGEPPSVSRPARGEANPLSSSASSVLPAPISPSTPSTSPDRMVNDNGRLPTKSGTSSTVAITDVPRSVWARCCDSSVARPSMSCRISFQANGRELALCTVPSRRTTTSSASASISPKRCET